MRVAILVVLVACGSKSAPPASEPTTPPAGEPTPPASDNGGCIKTGCSGTICAEPGHDVITTCEMKPEYACYVEAECMRQADGACGWTMDDRLKSCLANPPPLG